MAADYAAPTSYGFMTAVVIYQDLVVDFGGEMQIMDDDLTQRDACAAAADASHAVSGITGKCLLE